MRSAGYFAFVVALAAIPLKADAIFLGAPFGTQTLKLTIGGGDTTLSAISKGWWDSTGFHDDANPVYATGDGIFDAGNAHNGFFVFDLPTLTAPITAAELSIGNSPGGYAVGPGSTGISVLSMYDVSTAIATLVADGVGQVGIYNDLASGVLFASRSVSVADNNSQVLISLNAAAIAALNSAAGGQFAIGADLVTDYVVPEPASFLLLGTVLSLAAGSRIRKQLRG